MTTEIGGQCGWSPAPFPKNAPQDFHDYIATIQKQPDFKTFGEAMDYLDTLKIGTNQAAFVGHHYLRGSVAGMANRDLGNSCGENQC